MQPNLIGGHLGKIRFRRNLQNTWVKNGIGNDWIWSCMPTECLKTFLGQIGSLITELIN